ncbi:PSD1 and planctomycete cytochrome C domain-containing protein [Seonamhaeicola sp.]|uniref:PSD1 and planctomycete cytochrome C domain-containing protein n=1 Tax=Seonamhaeicola sp. TaxID=1912245 RepID=UPI00260D5482|nr:PSD1 and planctomycete cytochrome C domain-containing protein [Seonamhaeicola sp.]
MKSHKFLWAFIILALYSCHEENIGFNEHVRPILNKKCISCHGGVKQSGGFGLVFRDNALGETKSGKKGIVPGRPGKSEMIKRITHADPELRMPPEEAPLTQEEIEILTKWVEQGAEWEEHWAYLEPKEQPLPVSKTDWGSNGIDAFIFDKLKMHGLSPNEEANPYDLVRRVYLDLIGLPPTTEQVEAFIQDNSEDKYVNMVDSLLASPRFGEHWASMWLDLARFADSRGYEKDRKRKIWQYRDWVIKAFNKDMPFDTFTIEQLAGDLLPDPSKDQYIATAFHRNTMENSEGGTENEEFRIAALMDRVNTTWEVWQSTTMSCVQCHSHPYDPIVHKDYYTSLAFFNNTLDWDGPLDEPLYRDYDAINQKKIEAVKAWVAQVSNAEEANKWEHFIRIQEPMIRPEDYKEIYKATHRNTQDQDFMIVYDKAHFKITDLDLSTIDRVYLDYSQRGPVAGKVVIKENDASGTILGEATLGKSWNFVNIPVAIASESKNAHLYFEFQSDDEKYRFLLNGILIGYKLPGTKDEKYTEIYNKIDAVLGEEPERTTPIMFPKPDPLSRTTQVFDRGNRLVPTDTVSPDVPKQFNIKNIALSNRLDFAQWLVGEDNHLTGRVTVNRFWAKLFGKGIVLTSEDFGALGNKPTHPELLDWLAIRFTEDWNWSVKTLLKHIVLSSTYKQSSRITEDAKQKDPYNQWLGRSSRERLSAEQIRDQALLVSGLLSDKMYGPSVMPYQPDGVWSVIYSNDTWETSKGADAYRRGLYTYLRRTSPYPSFVSFDASNRNVCLSRRINTNTPLQALVTLNDPVYFEAAVNIARDIQKQETESGERISKAFQRIMGKPIAEKDIEVFSDLLSETEAYYTSNKKEARQLVGSDNIELATLTIMTNAMMNMDAFLVKN